MSLTIELYGVCVPFYVGSTSSVVCCACFVCVVLLVWFCVGRLGVEVQSLVWVSSVCIISRSIRKHG